MPKPVKIVKKLHKASSPDMPENVFVNILITFNIFNINFKGSKDFVYNGPDKQIYRK